MFRVNADASEIKTKRLNLLVGTKVKPYEKE